MKKTINIQKVHEHVFTHTQIHNKRVRSKTVILEETKCDNNAKIKDHCYGCSQLTSSFNWSIAFTNSSKFPHLLSEHSEIKLGHSINKQQYVTEILHKKPSDYLLQIVFELTCKSNKLMLFKKVIQSIYYYSYC